MPDRIQRRRTAGWRMPEGAAYVGRPTKWGNPFRYRNQMMGLVRYLASDPTIVDFEGRISADGIRHPYYGPDGTIVDYWVRWATPAELVVQFRRTLFAPTRGMRDAYPSRRGHFAHVTPEEIRTELAGKDLACWCPLGQPCHADVLLEVANA